MCPQYVIMCSFPNKILDSFSGLRDHIVKCIVYGTYVGNMVSRTSKDYNSYLAVV